MKKNELKALIKPVVRECIQEVLLEEGLLSNVVAEVVKGMQQNMIVEARTEQPVRRKAPVKMKEQAENTRRKMSQHRQKLMESIGKDAYNGIDLFEGTQPLSKQESRGTAKGAVDMGSPTDAGVDISSIFGNAGNIWQAMK